MTPPSVPTFSCLWMPAGFILTGLAAAAPPEAAPLSPPSPQRQAATLFERRSLDFVNRIDNSHPLNRLYASSMCAGGLAVADVDGNGRPDIFCVNGPDKNALFLQTGDFEFVRSDCGLDGGEAWGVGAAFADVDSDGDLDVFVCNYESPNQLFLNESVAGGPLKFREAAAAWGAAMADAGHTPAFADYDGDGDLDLYLMTNLLYDPRGRASEDQVIEIQNGKARIRLDYDKFLKITKVRPGARPGDVKVEWDKKGRRDWLLRNDGGKFTDATVEAGMSAEPNMGLSATWWDYNADGRPDLYVGDDFDDPDYLYRNDGGGKFTNVIREAVPHTTWFSMGADFGDLNNDGAMDFLIGDMFGTNHYKQKVSMGPMGGKIEFLTTAVPRQYMRNALYANTGTGRFMEAAQMAGLDRTNWTWSILLQDFDNDGWTDAYITNGMSRDYNDSDNQKALDFKPGETEWQRHLRAGTPPLKEENLAFRNKGGTFEFEETGKAWGLNHLGMSFAAVSADLDRDGDLDLVTVNLDEPVFLYRNQSQDGNRVLLRLKGTKSERHGLGATVNLEAGGMKQTRQLTLLRGYLGCQEPIVHFGLGKAAKIDRLEVRWPSGARQVLENLDAGKFYTLTEPATAAPAEAAAEPKPLLEAATLGVEIEHKETPFDDFASQPLLPNKLSQLGPGLAVADVDGDGDDDLFLAGAAGQPGRVLLNDGTGKFTPAAGNLALLEDVRSEDLGAVFFDADGDGDADLFVVSGGVESRKFAPEYQDRLYLNDGRGRFLRAPEGSLPLETDSGSAVAAADFDRDGDIDLFVGGRVVPGAYPETPASHLLVNDGKGIFKEAAAAHGLEKPGLVTSALWSDADDDGWLDLFLTCEWGPVKFFRNVKGTLTDQTADAGLAKLTGWWNGIAGRDIDGDGDIDYCAANFGLNTKYHASPEHPTLLYYGDFDGSGTKQLVEAEYEDTTLFPVRGRSCSSQAMPFIKEKFSSFKAFAVASLSDIYSPQKLQGADKFAAAELRTGILRNDGRARFTFEPLPRLAQISPAFGIVMSDLNADGHTDLLLAQNFWSPQAETGRMDGGLGLLLLGDGAGAFREVWPSESGFLVPGDAKSLVEGEFFGPGKRGWLVGMNDGAPKAFRPAAATADVLQIRIASPGVRVTAEYADGRKSTAESSAGSGYLSQSGPVITFGKATSVRSLTVRWPDGRVEKLAEPRLKTGRLDLVPPKPGR